MHWRMPSPLLMASGERYARGDPPISAFRAFQVRDGKFRTRSGLILRTASGRMNGNALAALFRSVICRHTKWALEVYGHVLGSDHTDAMDKIESVLLLPRSED